MYRFFLAIVLVGLFASTAWSQSAVSPQAPPLEVIENSSPRVEQPKVFVPGHKSKYGGWVRPQMREGPPLPITPGKDSEGYEPGHHDANGAWVPGHPK